MNIEIPDPPDDDNVIRVRFKRTKEDLPTAPVKKAASTVARPFCVTHFFQYDADARTVTCSRCERSFDPFEAFEHLARTWAQYDYHHRDARKEIAALHAERDKIAKQVANLKAQRRRLVPNVRQDVDRARTELWRFGHEKNPNIASAIMGAVQARLGKVLLVLERFGSEDAREPEKP